MDFSKAYNREEFVNFLGNSFLPEDFISNIVPVKLKTQMTYTTEAVKLGSSASLGLVVYEVKHNSKHDARVSLSKEAFRLLFNEYERMALVAFVPQDSDENYRLSLIEITLESYDDKAKIYRRYSNPRRYSYLLGAGLEGTRTIDDYLLCKNQNHGEIKRVVDYADLRERFSVEKLTKDFYKELQNWFACALDVVSFPNNLDDPNDNDKYNTENIIRLITRLIFVWFLKQKGLIPKEFFDEQYIADNLLKDFNPNKGFGMFHEKSLDSKYYKAILQNLFFAMLNSPITKDGKSEPTERRFRKLTDNGNPSSADFNDNRFMRYESMFKNPQLFIDLSNKTVPFLNGGLFDCLDKKREKFYLDGFSDHKEVQKKLVVPDYLFFSDDIVADLSTFYNDKKKYNEHVIGIIKIFSHYNFTIEENTPFDQEISLDPELLGKVFENLLASYNPETQTTARKQTGSFYTPREIVQYMVDESLVAYLKRTVGNELEDEYRKLLRYTDEDLNLTEEQKLQIMGAIYNCKILDPACGSGAFPVGMLQQMVHILSRLDPSNEQWKKMILDEAANESRNTFFVETFEEREKRLNDINKTFEDKLKNPDYTRKLYLIENCLYGVDIQSIAIQICKLRFFISLVVDQKANHKPEDNFGIRPLPNLEAKFVAANTLIELHKKDPSLFDNDEVKKMMKELKEINHKIFYAKHKTKEKYKAKIETIISGIASLLKENEAIGDMEVQQLLQWDRFDQNSSSPFFDSEWMFGVKEGFDIVIGNPPYIDSETMTNSMPEFRKYYKSLYTTAQGNWDMFVIFIERGIKLLNNKGCLSFIVPNKLISAKYANAIRDMLRSNGIGILRDYGAVSVFDASVYPCIFLLSKSGMRNNIIFESMRDLTEILTSKTVDAMVFHKDLFWDKYFIEADKLNVVLKIAQNELLVKLPVEVSGAATVSEAYELKKIIKEKDEISGDSGDSFQFVNTGTIDKFKSLWGEKKTQYIKEGYFVPIVEKEKLRNIYPKRYQQANASKIIVAGMSYVVEALFDDGKILAGKSTSIILGDKSILIPLVCILNSRLMDFWVRVNYNSLRMSGGYINIGVNELKSLPIANFRNSQDQLVKAYCDRDFKQIDFLVYKSYNLTFGEVLIVDPETPITREEYEDSILNI